MRPYAPANRCTKVFTGHQHNFEKNLLRCAWSADGSQVILTDCNERFGCSAVRVLSKND